MSQKDYNTKIVEALLKKQNHIRGLAKDLNTNQTTISRKLHDLHEKNIVDFSFEGKNKVFFLKNTLEAKEYAFMAEKHKMLDAINTYPRLRRIIETIKDNKNITLAIIFGSYSKGNAKKDSDIDLYIETEDRKLKDAVAGIDSRLSIKIGIYDKRSILIKEIEKNHIIVKGIDEFYEKSGFFG